MFLLHFIAQKELPGFAPLFAAIASVTGALSDAAKESLVAELSRPKSLPNSDTCLRVDVADGLAVEWRENDPQEKVSRYYYGYVRAGDATLWGLGYASALFFEKDLFVWFPGASWTERAALAEVLALRGWIDKSDETLLPWVMHHETGARREEFASCYEGRKVIGESWVGARYLSRDIHFPMLVQCAWREEGDAIVDGSWIPHGSAYRAARATLSNEERRALDGYFGVLPGPYDGVDNSVEDSPDQMNDHKNRK